MADFDFDIELASVAKELVAGNKQKAVLAITAILTRVVTGSSTAAAIAEATLAKAMANSSEGKLNQEYAQLTAEEQETRTQEDLKQLIGDAIKGDFDRIEKKLGHTIARSEHRRRGSERADDRC